MTILRAVRQRLGLLPGTTLEWHEVDGTISIQRAGVAMQADIRAAIVFKATPRPLSVEDMDDAIAARMKAKYGRGKR